MLRRFLYLDATALGQYVTALEGGIVTESRSRSLRSGTGSGGVDAKVVKGAREDEESRTLADTDEARFERLLQAVDSDPEAVGWVEVLDPDTDFNAVGIGAMISWECDIFIPDVVQLASRSGEAVEALDMMQNMLPMARELGLDTDGLPSDREMTTAAGMLKSLNTSLLVVGEDDDTQWRVAGKLTDGFVHGDIEGRAKLVGKVSKIFPLGRWKPFLTFPGMNLVPREERRRMERQAPSPEKEAEYLSGPALMLDILAIYR